MTLTAQQTAIVLAPTDEQGYPCAPEVTVWIDYICSVDASYGEDADGRQGAVRVEYEILDCYIEAEDAQRLSLEQIEAVLDEARMVFGQRQKHF